jgi:hypothetical protein
MGRVQDERWEFDLDLPRSEKDDQVRRPKVVDYRWGSDGYLYRLLRVRDGSTRLERQ